MSTPTASTPSPARVADHMLVNYAGVLKVDGEVGDKDLYDPRAWGQKGEEAIGTHVTSACELLGSEGKSLA
jgi:fructose-bisphosphate aldolase, class II